METKFEHHSFTDVNWNLFAQELSHYRNENKTIDELKYLIDNGALVQNKHKDDRINAIKNVEKYREFTDKLSKYNTWCARKQYAEKKRLESYEQSHAPSTN